MDIFEGVMRIEIVEGSVRGLRGVVVSGFSEVVAAVGGSVEEHSVGGASVSEEEDEEVTAAAGVVSSMVLATTSGCGGSGKPSSPRSCTIFNAAFLKIYSLR